VFARNEGTFLKNVCNLGFLALATSYIEVVLMFLLTLQSPHSERYCPMWVAHNGSMGRALCHSKEMNPVVMKKKGRDQSIFSLYPCSVLELCGFYVNAFSDDTGTVTLRIH
jgi:hypothetical protein